MSLFPRVEDLLSSAARVLEPKARDLVTTITKDYIIPSAIIRLKNGDSSDKAMLNTMLESYGRSGKSLVKAGTSFIDSWTGNALTTMLKSGDPKWEKEIEESAIRVDQLERLMKAAQADVDDLVAQYNSLRDTSEDIDTRLDDLLSPLGFVNSAQVKSLLNATMKKQATDVDNAVKSARSKYLDKKDRLEQAIKKASGTLSNAQTDYQKAVAEHDDLKNQTITERI